MWPFCAVMRPVPRPSVVKFGAGLHRLLLAYQCRSHVTCYDAAEECITSAYTGSYSAVSKDRSCFVTYGDQQLTWYAAAKQCIVLNGNLASFDVTDVTDTNGVNFITIPPSKCSWVGLVKEVFYWTEIQGEYACTRFGSFDFERIVTYSQSLMLLKQ